MSCKFFSLVLLMIFFYHGETIEPSKRIFGGEDARIEDFPYMAYFRHRRDGYVCAGAIISRDHVLTTGACVMVYIKTPYHEVIVVTGTNSLIERGNEHMISYTAVHPEFFKGWNTSIRYDYAVVTLCSPLKLDGITEKSIELASSPIIEGADAVVTAWGFTDEYEKSGILQKLHTKVYNLKKCGELDSTNEYDEDESRICTVTGRGKGICEHDNGAPLVVDGKLVGVASLRHTCGLGWKDQYANIYIGLSFIQREIDPEICT